MKCPKCKKDMEERELTYVCKDCTVLLKQDIVDIKKISRCKAWLRK